MKPRGIGTRWVAGMALALSLGLSAPMMADGEHSPASAVSLSPQQMELARQVKSEVMAPCCWNGTVDSHNSPAAVELANKIDRQVAEGRSREEILETLSGEYGERILARPRTEGFGLVFYLGPAAALIFGGIFVSQWLRRNVRRPGTEAPVAAGVAEPAVRDSGWDQRFEEQLKRWDKN